jgi:hypothetical protein
VSDIDTAVVDSLKALDPEWPIREADIRVRPQQVRFVPTTDIEISIAGRSLWFKSRRILLSASPEGACQFSDILQFFKVTNE